MRLEELPAGPTCTGTCACTCSQFVRSGTQVQDTHYCLLLRYRICVAYSPKPLLAVTVTVLSSSRYHAIVSPRVCSAVTLPVMSSRSAADAQLGSGRIKLTYFGHVRSVADRRQARQSCRQTMSIASQQCLNNSAVCALRCTSNYSQLEHSDTYRIMIAINSPIHRAPTAIPQPCHGRH